jgi:uncharacterized protein (TIGR03437 family)
LFVCTVLGLPYVAILRAQNPISFIDRDGDGIDDNLEQQLANKFAPVIIIESDESNYPVNVEWFLQRAHIQYHEDCFFDVDDNIGPNPLMTQPNLIGPPYVGHAHCGQNDTGYSHPPHRDINRVANDPDGQWSVGSQTTGYSDQQTFVLPDLADSDKVGSLNPTDWKTYFHAYPANDGGIMLQYWHLFAYNGLSLAGFGNHGGDWDATIHVQLGPDLRVEKVWFSRHTSDHPGDPFDASQVTFLPGTNHPLMTIDGGGHAAFASPADFCTNQSAVGGTAAWPQSITNPLDATTLASISCSGLIPIFSGSHPGGTVWETWEGGTVFATNNLTHQILSPSSHGGMVNLGEYNPCGIPEGYNSTCYGSKQASTLLAGQLNPLNDQIFIAYEGYWGSLPSSVSVAIGVGIPPRGPVFQGRKDAGEGHITAYAAWYNEGADQPASPATQRWRQPPTTTWTLMGPRYSSGRITFISGTTSVSFIATTNKVAADYGSPYTYYRVYPVQGTPPQFVGASGALQLAPPDGAYQIEFYSMDALNNQEPTRSSQLTLDMTPPVIIITQPTATNYPHGGTLTLSYSVSDGQGSGVKSLTPKIDGATIVSGHGLLSGQNIDLAELSPGPHTFSVDAVDNLDNASTQSVTFFIIGPVISKGGVVIHAGTSATVSPGSIVDIYGTDLAPTARSAPDRPALPSTLNGVQVMVISRAAPPYAAPLFYVGPTQIDFQMPYEASVGTASVVVFNNGTASAAAPVSVQQAAPFLLTYGTANNRAIVVNPNGSLNGPSSGAKPGDVLVAYLTGSGPLDNAIATGAKGPLSPLSRETLPTTVTVGHSDAAMQFAGMSPGSVGLMQVNFVMPDVAGGDYPIQVSIGGAVSNQPLITVDGPTVRPPPTTPNPPPQPPASAH